MIYIVKHKEFKTPKLGEYKEINVGKAYIDDGRDNINHLNPYINELTALYDIWKNSDYCYVGMVHYRRYFWKDNNYLSHEEAVDLLSSYDIITTGNYDPEINPYESLKREMSTDLLDKYMNLLPERVQEWFKSKNGFNVCNMFFARKDLIDRYCEWVFPIIIPLAEQFIREDANGDYRHDRALGYISERLFGYWCRNLDKYPVRIINVEEI